MAGESERDQDDFKFDLQEFGEDNRSGVVIASAICDRLKTEPCCLGIDEAGRGPVLGPMVYGTCFCPIADKERLKEMGFADSKTLTEEKRENLFQKIQAAEADLIGWAVHILSPNQISNSMLRRSKYNLNELSHDTAIGLIQKALDSGVNVDEVFVDTVGMPEKYQAKLERIFPELKITVAKKADATYPIVSAASICAKVSRDHAVKSWNFIEGRDYAGKSYGSGYPGDSETKNFLSESMDPVFGFPQFVRFSWSTASNILDAKAVTVEWEDDDEMPDDVKSTPAISSYFSGNKTNAANAQKKHQFFTDRSLHQVSFI
ncbi:hypothetical protein CAPTEDRAFT_183401 [Capitella teleta]|uniref:Ribonuclease n=1 Tax=Capitella teleta TaxID=283909 RepID=R7U7R0_CAPTE|nr:hypothetical protein CAPTEDRAFT_183401 [Capitella teleta]|eukprot:ELT99170.1 hypothetical protein CAPTEDRAFT_183401 [Capitella teleta]